MAYLENVVLLVLIDYPTTLTLLVFLTVLEVAVDDICELLLARFRFLFELVDQTLLDEDDASECCFFFCCPNHEFSVKSIMRDRRLTYLCP